MKKILRQFFCNSEGTFQPIYFWATLFLMVTLAMLICRFFVSVDRFSDTLILGMMAGVIGFITIYTWNNKRLDKNSESVDNSSKKEFD